jgi:hypothetical protein
VTSAVVRPVPGPVKGIVVKPLSRTVAAPAPAPTLARRDGVTVDPVQLLAAIADLLTPCTPPDTADGANLCAHAQPWPCPVTRAAWLATALTTTSAGRRGGAA